MTGNDIGDEGAIALCDGLKVNTTLISLDLRCEEDEKRNRKAKKGSAS